MHIQDPDFFDEFYTISNKLDKDAWYYAFVASQDAAFGTADYDLHRARRKAMSRFFSSSAIARLETSSREKVLKLCGRLEGFRDDGKPVNLSNAFRCLAADSVTAYCMPRGFNLLDSVDFADDYNQQARSISYIAAWHRHIPIIIPLFMKLPRSFIEATSTEGGLMSFDFQTVCSPSTDLPQLCADISQDLARQAESVVKAEKRSDKSVLDGIVNSDAIPESDKTVDRITQEARTLVGAGSETTGAALEFITFHVLSNPEIYHKLKKELAGVVAKAKSDDALTKYENVQRLPYLTAVIHEGLRIGNVVSGRMARSNPRTAYSYRGYVLPPKTVISMVTRGNHNDPSIYPDPFTFKPERWLVKGEELKRLEKYFVPFGRGGRSCIGKELALMNLYLMTASFFHKFDAELYSTSFKDISMEHDLFSPFPAVGSSGLRVKLKAKS